MKIIKQYSERPRVTSFTVMEKFSIQDGDTINVDPKLLGTKTKLHINLNNPRLNAQVGANYKACKDLKYHPTTRKMNYFSGGVKEKTCLKWIKSQGQEAIEKHVEEVLNQHFSYLDEVTLVFYPVK
jgi:hypothetical protein